MARYEYAADGSSKFWDIELDGSSLVLRWGRIGTQGQSQRKEFASRALAERELEHLVAEKTHKGYRLAEEAKPAAENKLRHSLEREAHARRKVLLLRQHKAVAIYRNKCDFVFGQQCLESDRNFRNL